MTKRLLIDASHAEETRVVVLDGNRLEDFDVETLSRRQLKGNIYLAKVVRVEPSLQAAFVEYGGNRHGFLAFGEIHPDYYQIPVADRQRLIAMQEEEARAEEAEFDDDTGTEQVPPPIADQGDAMPSTDGAWAQPLDLTPDRMAGVLDEPEPEADEAAPHDAPGRSYEPDAATLAADDVADGTATDQASSEGSLQEEGPAQGGNADENAPELEAVEQDSDPGRVRQIGAEDAPSPATVGGEVEVTEDSRPQRQPSRFLRSYKIQEVIRRRQILLVQIVKEERGTKGAALTTYISLAGRYCVLMPNSPRGGGISRKITSAADRRRLKEVTAELDLPRGMGLIVRTAGAARPKPEIKRDGEYLLRLWDDIRDHTMRSIAPALIHEEASLIKRAIRDVYSRDIDELLVDGQDGWRAARDYMRMLMPTHVKKVQLWPSGAQPLFAHNQVESMLDSMLNPVVQLRSGGYLVINQTEALVAIDVNSGRSTRERGIEETALRTNLEAADEAARQLRLRDLAGLIVIDFIDMESKKHNAMVERRMADALRHDRARIQIGHISHFGLLELSRQRLRPSLAETSLNVCATCGGSGYVRSTESAALHVLREIEEEGGRRRAAEIMVHLAGSTALYILNNKRERLTEIEARYGMRVCFSADASLLAAQTRIERLRAAEPQDLPALATPQAMATPDDDVGEADLSDEEDDVASMGQGRVEAGASTAQAMAGDYTTDADHVPGETAAEGEQRRRRRRRRRRGGRREESMASGLQAPMPDNAEQPDLPDLTTLPDPAERPPTQTPPPEPEDAAAGEIFAAPPDSEHAPIAEDADQARPKRGRRGGRRRRKPGEEPQAAASDQTEAEAPANTAATYTPYVGPTPADPFGMPGLDIFDVLEQAELRPVGPPATTRPPASADMALPLPTAAEHLAEAEPAAISHIPEPDSAPVATSSHEPIAGPLIQPVLIGSTKPAAAPKRGWWRR